MNFSQIEKLLGDQAEHLLGFNKPKLKKSRLNLPGPNFIDEVLVHSNRSPQVLKNLHRMFNHGRLAGTGYLSILPIDQGIEHTAGISFFDNTNYFDPEHIVKLAIEGGCNAVASTYGVLAMMSKKYADKVPFIVKINHNELLTYPNKHDQIMFASAKQAAELGAAGIGATIYFGAPESNRQIQEVSKAFEEAHQLGLFTVLWCYTRNKGFQKDGVNYEAAADLTSQANHLGATIGADIVKQKMPENDYGFQEVGFGKHSPEMYDRLTSDHPIDRTRLQVANCYMGRVGLINSGGGSGDNDLKQVVTTAVINKRAGGTGLITGRKAFKKTLADGIKILNAVQDVYLEEKVSVA
jgi:fructose-bisphosphate aldolase, class I